MTDNKINISVLVVALILGGLSLLAPTDAESKMATGNYSYVCCDASECSDGDECSGDGSFQCCSDNVQIQYL
ncbi:hypothetical protein [Fodinibius saliphilus]|uniref:hypothetical protein n=1 Tax=Fodinibius saliphilus TaxID=1920650 RepID=UPI0011095440|nr:hypothetical protein [Fodinibius saliphilus]